MECDKTDEVYKEINGNIRCFEIYYNRQVKLTRIKINGNIRCFEIKKMKTI